MHIEEINETINDLKLPQDLLEALQTGMWEKLGGSDNGQWSDESKIALFRQLFPHAMQLSPKLFGLESMKRINKMWSQPDIFDAYIGAASLIHPPGNVDPTKIIIIGESDPDSPIALDYRTSNPRVIYFCDIGTETLWVEATESISILIETFNAQ